MKDLSIIIVSYNTKEITKQCIESIYQSVDVNHQYEIIVVDNGSDDGSANVLQELKRKCHQLILIKNSTNLGFTKANNKALEIASGRYILFLNSDVIIENLDFKKLIQYLDQNSDVGVLTVKVLLTTGLIDPASHRGFPTLWNTFCYFLKLDKIFARLPYLKIIFCGYHLGFKNLNNIHEIDSPSGAFYLTRKEILDKIGHFDEDFFMYGEDLDLSYRIKKYGLKIVYYPLFNVTHLKYASGLGRQDQTLRKTIKNHFYTAMKIFYKKHYEKKHFWLLNKIIYVLIDLKKLLRRD